MRRRLELLALALVIVAVVVLSAVSRKAGSDDNHTDPELLVRSSYYTYPEGYKALYLTLQELGYPVSRQSRPYALLPPHGIVIIADPYRAGITVYESRQLFAWLGQGNTALVLVERHPRMLADLTATTGGAPADEEAHGAEPPAINAGWEMQFASVTPATPTLAHPLGGNWPADAPDLQVLSSCRFPRQELLPRALMAKLGNTHPLYADASGVVALSSQLGSGQIIWCCSPWSFSNAGLEENQRLADASNLDVLLALIDARPDRPIVFDEYHHGYGAGMTVLSLAPSATRWGLAQLALVLLLMLALAAWRLGPIRLPASARYTRSRAEYLTSMAGLLQRAGATDMVLARLDLQLKRDMSRRLGLALSSEPAQILAANAVNRAVDQSRMTAIFQRVTALRAHRRPDEESLLQLAADIHALLRGG